MTHRDDFSAFVSERSQPLLRTAYLLTRDWALAEDLLQTALAKAWSAWRRIEPATREAYVRKILVNAFLSWRRRRWVGEEPWADPPDRPGADPYGAVDDRSAIWQLLGRLPARQRAVVVLRYYEDLSEAQAAELLGCSVGTVKSQHARALAALRGHAGTPTTAMEA
ncbi:SigE family RNA polymerase sigma factor [Allonocardiopsis opalescens]|uniref:RNA polymerase sigma-70 factor (Sigma-E family) n=1 Tax=Allonocardiopsis opalescens TaxID=1144618 RepID=A0A2T0PZR0_9ACTN|nr:SigE family RNA polymerase sigma factor [Allonocardiopsis opalescens]PRX97017.1 RNA polymerase sigma-70 factor (sigma-E family) [Allonocardiopsis opalescens]